ncbi:hypothetical protein Ppb6_00659 [Photorhabdus australis subsp. thailandensis]|uniref:Uncharacterized protein n=1 Tax=Photorhabdus australis subsp. thailandensis TaxID=2805096 RepID=A0A1C0U875_9GAMM|nr:hypothetical protein Ppb6_00659 [Photorhabdus australis subsp. thailandensis]
MMNIMTLNKSFWGSTPEPLSITFNVFGLYPPLIRDGQIYLTRYVPELNARFGR